MDLRGVSQASAKAAVMDRCVGAVPLGVANATAIVAAPAPNAEIWDAEGRRYVDFAGGIAVLNVGHRHPRVIAAVEEQLAAYTHTAFPIVPYEPYIALAERLNAVAPFSGPATTIFFTTGADASSDERLIGTECFSSCRSRWSPYASQQKKPLTLNTLRQL